MSDYPVFFSNMPRRSISSAGPLSLGDVVAISGQPGASAVWPAANRAIYVPCTVERTSTVIQMACYNGTVAAGNVDIGIYDLQRNRLVSSGATAQAGTSTLQVFNVTDTTLTPGVYYLALMCTSASATIWRATPGAILLEAHDVAQEATGGTLPATATFANPGNSYLPCFTASLVATI